MKLSEKIFLKFEPILGKYEWYNNVKQNATLRTLLFSAFGILVTIGFAVYNGVFGIIKRSPWHGTLAGYMIILAIQRVLLIVEHTIVYKKYRNDEERLNEAGLRIYRANGIAVVPFAIIMAIIVVLLVNFQKPVQTDKIMAIANAAFAFYKISLAIKNVIDTRKSNAYVLQTMRNVNLISALVSIILLHATLITTFGEMNKDMLILTANIGFVFCAFIIAIGIYMIVSSTKKIKRGVSKEKNIN